MIGRALAIARDCCTVRKQRPVLPRFLTHTVTFRCNARCIMCDSWKIQGKNDLTLEEIERIYDQLPRLDAVRLTGGEPFVRTDFLGIADAAAERLKPAVLHVTTNGFLTERIVDFCEKRIARRLHMLVSIDGDEEKHNHVRGSSIAFRTAFETVRQLAQHRREWNLNLAINQTIVDAEGVEHYRRLRERLRPYDVPINVVLAYDVSATYSVKREIDVAPKEIGQFTTFGSFTPEQIESLLTECESDLSRRSPVDRYFKRYYFAGIRARLLSKKSSPNPKCVSLNQHLRIFPNGDVPTCQFNSKTVGNLREAPFETVWFGERAESQRDWVRKCPGCWAECEVYPNALYTLDVLRARR